MCISQDSLEYRTNGYVWVCVCVYKEMCYKQLAYNIMGAQKSPDLQLAS